MKQPGMARFGPGASPRGRRRMHGASGGRDGGPLRIALLVHSTHPRGGVVHALELAEALVALGAEPVVHAPDPGGGGFFRPTRCATVSVPARADGGSLRALVGTRIEDYVAWFSRPGAERFDVYHAQDGISGNALADLTQAGRCTGFVRTVHHLDDFDDPQVAAWQRRSVLAARRVLCVSRLWRQTLEREYGVAATEVGNGVDRRRFSPARRPADPAARIRYGIVEEGPVFLSIGGIEARKNTLRLLDAFLAVRRQLPRAQLVIAGGKSLLDHRGYQAAFNAALGAGGIRTGPGCSVVVTGPVSDEDMPALYRSASALVFPSTREGFGLAVIEAMASGLPVVVSRIEPFTDYLGPDDCAWADPLDPASIAKAMISASRPDRAAALRQAGLRACARFSWEDSARRHLEVYRGLAARGREAVHA